MLSDLFKDMKLPSLLERRIIESFLYANETVSEIRFSNFSANNAIPFQNYFELNSFLHIMGILTMRATDDELAIGYIFDIFSKYHPYMLN